MIALASMPSFQDLIYFTILISVSIIGIVRFKRLTIPFKLLVGLVLITIVSEAVNVWMANTIQNNSPVFHVYIFVQFGLLTLIYRQLFVKKKLFRILFLVSIGIFYPLCLLNLLYFQSFFTFPSNAILIASTILISWVILSMVQMLLNPTNDRLLRQPLFWFNVANLIFYSGSFFYWSFLNYFLRNKIAHESIPVILNTLLFSYYICYGISLYWAGKEHVTAEKK